MEIQTNRLSIVEQSLSKSSEQAKALRFEKDCLITQNLDGLFTNEMSGLKLSESLQTSKLIGSYDSNLE